MYYYISGDTMKVYFVFNLKKEFVNLYRDNNKVLFDIFRSIYLMRSGEVDYAYTLFDQLVNNIDAEKMDREIFIKYHKYIPYSKHNKIHLINNLYKNEISRMIIKNSYIKIELDSTNTSWFDVIKNYSSSFFACDFKNNDYFFL